MTLVTADFKGFEVSDHWAYIEFNEDVTNLLRCVAALESKSSVYDKNTQSTKHRFH